MALAVYNVCRCSGSQNPHRTSRPQFSNSKPSLVRFSRIARGWSAGVVCAAASAAGSSNSDSEFNPYEVLGVSPFEGFDTVKTAYAKRRKEAERDADETEASRLEKAYDKIMMSQLTSRKKGVTHGSIKISKDIKYADKQPIVPWGPRFTKSSEKDIRINLVIAAVLTAWIVVRRSAEYKPLQFLVFAFVYRLFEKLRSFEGSVTPTYTIDGEDTSRALRMSKRLLRSLALVFGCIAVSAMGYTLLLNLIEYAGGSIPVFLYNNQELIVTASSALMLYVMASYYR